MPLRSPTSRDKMQMGNQMTEVNYPMFVFCRGKRCDQEVDLSHLVYSHTNSINSSSSAAATDDDDDDEDEFVII